MKIWFYLLIFFSGLILSFSFTSNETKEYTLFVFEGSDWCPNCLRLEKNILADSLFTAFVSKHEIEIEKIDFPQRIKLTKAQKKYNELIAEKYSFDGSFPSLVIVERETDKFKKIQYTEQSPEKFIQELQRTVESLK